MVTVVSQNMCSLYTVFVQALIRTHVFAPMNIHSYEVVGTTENKMLFR